MKQPKNPAKYIGVDVYLCGDKATIVNVVEEFILFYVHRDSSIITKHQKEGWGLVTLPGLVERLINKVEKIATRHL